MKFILYTNALSAHQIPLAREIVKLVGVDSFKYIYTSKEGQKLQESSATDSWIEYLPIEKTNEWLEDADVMLVGGIRPIGLCERRAASGKTTYYMSERWFKPSIGMFRLLVPSYRRMAERFVRLLDVGGLVYLPIGIHAARDMARLCGLLHGDIRCLFRVPMLEFERFPGGKVWLRNNHVAHAQELYCLDKMRMWGYFVEPSRFTVKSPELTHNSQLSQSSTLRILWVGRLLRCKRVDTIIKAVGELSKKAKVTLDIYGTGSEEARLKRSAAKYGDVTKFYPPVPINEVRNLMRSHDVYVLASNAYEGWGAVVSEALEESMCVVGTYEAGSSATILPITNLFHVGDWRRLMHLLTMPIRVIDNRKWTARQAANWLCKVNKLI